FADAFVLKRHHRSEPIFFGDPIACSSGAMAHRARNVESLLPALHQVARHFNRNTSSPLIAHLAGVVIICAHAETRVWMRPGTDFNGLRFSGLGLRHFVPDRNCARNWQTRTAPICEQIEWRLCAHLRLAHHVGKNFSWRLRAFLAAKAKHRDDRDGRQKKNHEKSTQHNQSSCTMVMCCPPVCSSNWRTPSSVNRGSRASIARKNPSFVTRLKRSQLNIG